MVEWYSTLTPEQEREWVAAAKAGVLMAYLDKRGPVDVEENIRQQAAIYHGVSTDDITWENGMPKPLPSAVRRAQRPAPTPPPPQTAAHYDGAEEYRRRLTRMFEE